DSAQRLRENDDLGRWRFAAEIAEVIRSTPADWSARIGVYGKWGEGKSTVLHFLEEMLKEGNVVFYFTPWAVQQMDELWAEFGDALLTALRAANLGVEPQWKEAARSLQEKLESTALTDMAQGAAAFFGKGEVYNSALRLLVKWLRPDGEQVKKIREKLGDKRVIVFIDDLDRASPEMLPKLLLSLREILDLPGFTFVLAFDNEIVANGIATANPAWGDGDSFLAKILDFHYHLPPISRSGKRLLLSKMLSQFATFVPQNSIDPIEHLLPPNPRKLKQLVRGLVTLQPQLRRYDEGDLNWVEIWLAEMIRQESYEFFVRLLDGGRITSLLGIGYRIRNSDRTKKDEDKNADVEIKKIIEEVGEISEKKAERLMELVNATRELAGFQMEHSFKFALRPEIITWKELNELIGLWKNKPIPETISAWIAEQSADGSISEADVETDLYGNLLNEKQDAATRAAEASTVKDNATHCREAQSLLKMTEQFLNLPKMLTAERLGELHERSLYWIAFRKNPADRELREAERDLLLALVDRVSNDDAPAALAAFKPWDPRAFPSVDEETSRRKRELRDKCVARLLPKVENAFPAYLSRPESLRQLSTPEGAPSFRYILFQPDRLPWSEIVRNALLETLGKAESDPNAYDKANEFLQLLVGTRSPSSTVGLGSAVEIVKDREFVAALWKGATSRQIQHRMLQSYLSKRKALLQMGAQENDLPLSAELAQANEASNPNETEPEDL
ncbi:MAG: P-loop NTPase fold protein, partial [Acidobacteriota bacterium]